MKTVASLPILDFSQLQGDSAQQRAFLDKLSAAARDVGFFYLINHGVDASLSAQVQQQARHFFSLSEEARQQVSMIHSPHFRGYNRAGSERTRSAPDWREQFDIGAERPALSLQPGDPWLEASARAESLAARIAAAQACTAVMAAGNDCHGAAPAAGIRPGAGTSRRRVRPAVRRQAIARRWLELSERATSLPSRRRRALVSGSAATSVLNPRLVQPNPGMA